MDKVNINIQVGEMKHPLVVDPDDEPVYREAARLINERLTAYQKKYRVSNLSSYHMLSFALLDIAAQYVRLHRETDIESVQNSVKAIADDLESFNLDR
ncbi:MAG: cell division protein ZapA [Bacteroidales bacterium]|nr:cell division protein ZapA [Bacteroidales bacterium]